MNRQHPRSNRTDTLFPNTTRFRSLYETVDGERHTHVQEYAAPKTVAPHRAEKRLRGALAGVQSVLDIAPARLHYKLRQSQKGTSQYQRQGDNEHMVVIDEHGCKLHVNFDEIGRAHV